MKKAGQKTLMFILPLFFVFVFLKSCTPGMVVSRLTNREEKKENTITALIPEGNIDLAYSAEASNRRFVNQGREPPFETPPDGSRREIPASGMILEKGNYWTRGIPGFGENGLSAFAGEYRIPGKKETVKVWMTMEFIYYEGWANRASITGIQVQEKMSAEGLLAALTLNDNWTVVMNLPPGLELGTDGENRIILDLVNKLTGFSNQIHNISFPAIITYK
jgi:hypothetical protein